ncbi:CAP domain-containing protein [Kockovaella imperatae]|uniref:CAP domain-containing protein n=1 Tax=Kockovaella imperatae TaxID=4999 RepID=A0A1Y1ULN7_9TREE|nr:CAP domain-containing protein [Kockovaella imperatae]ORX38899.1 CAP domain-containing protein [Kockovaella imperatae]
MLVIRLSHALSSLSFLVVALGNIHRPPARGFRAHDIVKRQANGHYIGGVLLDVSFGSGYSTASTPSLTSSSSGRARGPLRAGFLDWNLVAISTSSAPDQTSSVAISSSISSHASSPIPTHSSTASITSIRPPQVIHLIEVGSGVAGGNQATYTSNAPPSTTVQSQHVPDLDPDPNPNPHPQSQAPLSAETSSTSVADGVPVPGPTYSGTSGDQAGWVRAHNAYRSQYQAPALTWSDDMMWKAKGNAELCTYGHTNTGENIAWGPDMGPDKVIDMWMSEAPLYDWSHPGYQDPAGHFTQVIWVDSLRVGCYIVNCPDGGQQATCEYDPIGNYVNAGMFQANVKPKT